MKNVVSKLFKFFNPVWKIISCKTFKVNFVFKISKKPDTPQGTIGFSRTISKKIVRQGIQ